MLSLEQRLDKIEEVIKKPSFRQNKGLGNEVGYYIFDYPAEQELVVRERIEYIRQKNEEAIDGFRIVVFDLYDIIISISDRRNRICGPVADGNRKSWPTGSQTCSH